MRRLLLVLLAGCHAPEPVAEVSGSDCDRCHIDVYETSPFGHAAVGYGRDCAECHTNLDWLPTNDPRHDEFWPLVGAHADQRCAECHTASLPALPEGACVACHAADRDGATPSHAHLPDLCEACHTAVAWRPADLDHEPFYPLRGAHVPLECGACHVDDVYDGTPRVCVGCHADDRDRAAPPHAGFPADCAGCHSQVAWRPAALDHAAFFPLRGAPAALHCGACHVDEVYAGTPRACVGCHADDRDRAVPPHAGFPAACGTCHSEVAWRPAAFDHAAVFPLVGRHAALECGDCHVNDVYAGTPRVCVGCHADDRDRAAPSHAGFPADCAECHGQNAWTPARFEHDRFPVPHEGVRACDDCHPNPNDFAVFTCTDCHAHSRGEMDDEHLGEVRDYRYDSAACFRCHPRGDD